MKTEYTSGPWHIAYYGETERAVIKHGPDTIAQVEYADDGDSNKITHANARLIAATPDLLAALETVPIHRLDETPAAFIERFKVWYRETRNPALTKAGSSK